MKRTTFAILFTILITLSCAFASCNAREGIIGQDDPPDTEINTEDYGSLIRELEDQIIELKQNQYISESKRAEEILRIEKLIADLKQSDKPTDTETDNESNTDKDTADTDTSAPSSPTGKFLYTVENGEAVITGYTGDDTALTLPSSIDGYTVTRISDDAFSSDTLQSITVPEGIIKIGWFAFRECSALRTVTLPESVKSIGYSAFPAKTDSFTLICPAESFAQKYAESYGISVTAI